LHTFFLIKDYFVLDHFEDPNKVIYQEVT